MNMRLWMWLAEGIMLASLLACSPKVAKAPAANIALPATECPTGHPHMLWRVNSGNTHVWLLGSIHMADSSLYPLDSVVQRAFDESVALAVEINVTEDSVAAEVGERMAAQGLLAEGKTLDQVVGPQLWAKLDSTAHALGGSSETLLPMQPWLAALQIANLAVLKTGIDAALGIDVVLIDAAYEADKDVLSLETPAQQIGVFTDLPESTQVRYLETTLQEAGEAEGMVDSLKHYWRCGDDGPLGRMLLEQEPDAADMGELKEKLYDQRNQVMATTIGEYLQENRIVFVVVGTAHLLGEGSVVDLLKKQGYEVVRY